MNNDLISRSALKEAFSNNCVHNCYYCNLAKWDKKGACYNCGLIDNAPTVETDIEVVAKDAYEHGYADGWKERFGEPNERQQGEESDNLCDDCKLSDTCSLSLKGLTVCKTTKCFRKEWMKNE